MTNARRTAEAVFCGTPSSPCPRSKRCSRGPRNRAGGSQPDRPVGRAATHRAAREAGRAGRRLAVTQPEKIRNNAEFRAQLEAIAPDAIVVVAYGRIIPPWMLALPRLGCINLHASLLPKYRGAAPIQWAVAMGDAFHRQHHHAARRRPRHRPDSAAADPRDRPEQTATELFPVLAAPARRWW
jgi:methionyl-tRNA formyltransferase